MGIETGIGVRVEVRDGVGAGVRDRGVNRSVVDAVVVTLTRPSHASHLSPLSQQIRLVNPHPPCEERE